MTTNKTRRQKRQHHGSKDARRSLRLLKNKERGQ